MISRIPSRGAVKVYIDPKLVLNLDDQIEAKVSLSESFSGSGKALVEHLKGSRENVREALVQMGYKVIFSEQDGSYCPLSRDAIYRPSNAQMVQFAEKKGWVAAYLDPSSAATRSLAATGAASMVEGVPDGSGTQERVALSQTSGRTVSPSIVTARQSLPATMQGSMMTSGSIEPILPLVIGESHPTTGKMIYHAFDKPETLHEAAQRSLPFADALMSRLSKNVTGSEYCNLSHPSGPDIRYNKGFTGDSGGSEIHDLLEATLHLDHEGQVGEAVEELRKLMPGIPPGLHMNNPLGSGYSSHVVNVPLDSGVSMRVHIVPKEARGLVDEIGKISSKVKDWNLSDVVAAKKEIEEAKKQAFDSHRARAYAGGPLKFSESSNSNRFLDRSKVLVNEDALPRELSHLGEGSPARVVGMGTPKNDLIQAARNAGYTAIVKLSESGYLVWEPLSAEYRAITPEMVQFAKSKGYVNVDESGRQIGD